MNSSNAVIVVTTITDFRRVADLYMDFSRERPFLKLPAGERELFDYGSSEPIVVTPFVAKYYGIDRIVLSENDTRNIVALYDKAHSSGDPGQIRIMDYVLDIATQRMLNHMAGWPAQVISVGENCLPRTLTTKWGLKPSRGMGERTMPFDISAHSTQAVLNALESDFVGYASVDQLRYDDEKGYVVSRDGSIHWNHENGSEWSRNSFASFVATYARRIAAFKAAMPEGKIVAFFYSGALYSEEAVERLTRALKRLRGRASGLGLFAQFAAKPSDAETAQCGEVNGVTVKSITKRLPFPGYQWWQGAHSSTALGHAWERAIIEHLSPFMAQV